MFMKDVAAPGGGGGGIEKRACSSSLAELEWVGVVVGTGRLREPAMLIVWPGLRL